uniref:Major facilitator superfamily (MFS) profile domain-containing protein n=1 Tax=Timema cristinae TaxID=61476 RepID=A0A7R9CYX3_TIMCR|nr:unnamed protein product [Timema cristinae]
MCSVRLSIHKLSLSLIANKTVSNDMYRSSILLLTFMAYTCYHLSRKSISVVKNVLNQNCSFQMPDGLNSSDIHWCDWAPFNGNDSSTLLGAVDSSFLFAYAIAMYFSGYVAERVNLRYFLTFGMIMSGIFSYLFGLAYSLSIHSIWYFVIIQILAGIVQTTGWPGVVSVVGKWFGKEKRGLIFGIWNSHTSIGNILGSVIAGEFVETNWGVSFIAPGAIIAFGGFIIFLFLVENPSNVHCDLPTSGEDKRETSSLRWGEMIQRTLVQEKANQPMFQDADVFEETPVSTGVQESDSRRLYQITLPLSLDDCQYSRVCNTPWPAFNRHTYQRLTTENITDTSSEDSEDTNILEPGEDMFCHGEVFRLFFIHFVFPLFITALLLPPDYIGVIKGAPNCDAIVCWYYPYLQSGANLSHISLSHGQMKVRVADGDIVNGPGCGSVEVSGWGLASTCGESSGSSVLAAA